MRSSIKTALTIRRQICLCRHDALAWQELAADHIHVHTANARSNSASHFASRLLNSEEKIYVLVSVHTKRTISGNDAKTNGNTHQHIATHSPWTVREPSPSARHASIFPFFLSMNNLLRLGNRCTSFNNRRTLSVAMIEYVACAADGANKSRRAKWADPIFLFDR